MSVPKNKIKKIGHRARSSPKGHCNSLSGPWLKNITVFLRALYSPDNEFFLKRNTRCAVLYWGIILGVTGLESSPFYNILIAFFVLLFFFNPFKEVQGLLLHSYQTYWFFFNSWLTLKCLQRPCRIRLLTWLSLCSRADLLHVRPCLIV